MTITHPKVSAAHCEAPALVEVHALHALGEHDLVDLACGREDKERERENEE
jgi:hypothetical protein